ncbi:hypothetical protein THA_1950 [Thermosipho africanus TCF52B]|uniref:Uncharacterized protein n=1 Tax=Thermosipho africanus (strain TCF52B) TaxID=484019 RepID=B7IEE5_THEAB|nr:hypothetical protein THA_1950 [Thermosipho africanus TCF52B]
MQFQFLQGKVQTRASQNIGKAKEIHFNSYKVRYKLVETLQEMFYS